MDKPPSKRSFLALHELQSWEQGVEPNELKSNSSNIPSNTLEKVEAYMLAHQHFILSVNEILQDRANGGQSSYEQIYDNLLTYCAERAEVAARWNFLHLQPSVH